LGFSPFFFLSSDENNNLFIFLEIKFIDRNKKKKKTRKVKKKKKKGRSQGKRMTGRKNKKTILCSSMFLFNREND